MRFGANEKSLIEFKKQGIKVEALENKPTLFFDLIDVYELYLILDAHRQANGFTINPIAINDIYCILKIANITDTQRQEYFYIISQVDRWHVAFERKKQNDK